MPAIIKNGIRLIPADFLFVLFFLFVNANFQESYKITANAQGFAMWRYYVSSKPGLMLSLPAGRQVNKL